MLGGLSNSINRMIVNSMPLYPFVFLRQFLIFVVSIFVDVKRKTLITELKVLKSNSRIRNQLLISSLLSAIGTLLFYNALKMLPISIVSISDNGVYTVFSVILGTLFLKESLNKKSFCYLAICIVGLVLIITKGNLASFKTLSFEGLFLLALNSLLASINMTLTAVALKKVSASMVTSIKSFVSCLTAYIMVILYNQNILAAIKTIDFKIILFVLYGVFSGYMIQFLQNRSVQVLNLSKTAIFQLLTPLFSTFLGMLLFHEWFTLIQYVGIVLILFSLYKLK